MTTNPFDELSAKLDSLIQRVDDLAAMISQMHPPASAVSGRTWYNVAEAAEQMGKAVFTVREWCRLGRLAADRRSGSGKGQGWMIAATEIERYRNDGLREGNVPESARKIPGPASRDLRRRENRTISDPNQDRRR